MSENKKQNYLHGAAILAAGTVLIKFFGAIYKVPLGNILGDDGFGYFNAAYQIYNLFLTIATAGLPVALSRMISQSHTLGREMQVRRTFNVSLMVFTLLGTFLSLLMFWFPNELAALIESPGAAQSIWALSPAVLIVCVVAAYRGFAQGHENMKPTAISQIVEVVIKVVVGLALAVAIISAGKNLETASAGAIFGTTAGGFAALLYLFYYVRRHYRRKTAASPDVPEKSGRILKDLLKIGIPITLGSSILAIISLVDTKLVMNRLQHALGYTYEEANILYGIYGKAQALFNLPASIITPITIAIVPAIVAAIASRNKRESSEISESSMRISAVLALPMGVGLMVLCDPIINVLYPASNESGTILLGLLGPSSFFVCFALVMNAVLQANGLERYPVYSMIAGGIVKITVSWFLVSIPEVNIYGAPVGTLVCYIVMCGMNYIFMYRNMEIKPRIKSVLWLPVLSSAAMGLAAWVSYKGVMLLASSSALSGALRSLAGAVMKFMFKEQAVSFVENYIAMVAAMLVSIVVAVLVYLFAIVKTRAITMDDMRLIPKGEKLGRLLRVQEIAQDSRGE